MLFLIEFLNLLIKKKLRITVWSLTSKSVSYMKFPKNIANCYQFTNDGRFMILAERRECKDHCSIFSCDDWQLLKNFEVDTDDLQGLCWSPLGSTFAVWESSLEVIIISSLSLSLFK